LDISSDLQLFNCLVDSVNKASLSKEDLDAKKMENCLIPAEIKLLFTAVHSIQKGEESYLRLVVETIQGKNPPLDPLMEAFDISRDDLINDIETYKRTVPDLSYLESRNIS
jgi:hypothetical protein